MPWSPIPKLPSVMRDVRASGHTKAVNRRGLALSIMRVLGVTKDETIGRIIKVMQDLGYVRLNTKGTAFDLNTGKLYHFPTEKDENLDKFGV